MSKKKRKNKKKELEQEKEIELLKMQINSLHQEICHIKQLIHNPIYTPYTATTPLWRIITMNG